MLILQKICRDDSGKRLTYQYSAGGVAAKYFRRGKPLFAEYSDNAMAQVPEGIAVIPFLGNVLPVAWLAGFDVQVDEIDSHFFHCVEKLKEIFAGSHPSVRQKQSNLHYRHLTDSGHPASRSAFLFSGGVDSYATYLRLQNEGPVPVSVFGADISLHDPYQWQLLRSKILNNPTLPFREHFEIRSNLREFYTAELNLLVDDLDWWGRVQHGLSLITLLAPLSYLQQFSKIYIASSFSGSTDFDWGSSAEADQLIRWSGTEIIHEGQELSRLKKIELISRYHQKGNPVILRVCYNPLTGSLNCSSCEKCLRTIISLILSNQDPNEFGFDVSENVYEKIQILLRRRHASKAARYFWQEIEHKIHGDHRQYIFSDKRGEQAALRGVGELLRRLNAQEIRRPDTVRRFRQYLQLKFPELVRMAIRLARRGESVNRES